MNCQEPGCVLQAVQRKPFDGVAKCHKHSVRPIAATIKKVKMEKVRVIPRVVAEEFLLLFPDRPATRGTIAAWTLAGGWEETDELMYTDFGYQARSNYEVKRMRELLDTYARIYKVELAETTQWTAAMKQNAWR